MNPSLQAASLQLREAIREATHGLVERDQLAELMVLGAVANEHLLVIGPPGTGKSAVVRRVAASLGGNYFEYLLGRFTEPSELFGPVNLGKLRDGLVVTDTGGMLPEADVVFLDEVFLGSTAILNTLLGLLNERQFRRGHTRMNVPLRICVGAANGLPEDEGLAAFADRFLLHVFVEPVADNRLEDLLAGGWAMGRHSVAAKGGLDRLDVLGAAVPTVDMAAVRPALAQCRAPVAPAGVGCRTAASCKSQRLWRPPRVLAGATVRATADLWPLLYRDSDRGRPGRWRAKCCASVAEASHTAAARGGRGCGATPSGRVARLAKTPTACCWARTARRRAHGRRPCCARSTPISTRPGCPPSWPNGAASSPPA